MKVTKFDAKLIVRLPEELKKEAEQILYSKNMTLSEFIRDELEKLVKSNKKRRG